MIGLQFYCMIACSKHECPGVLRSGICRYCNPFQRYHRWRCNGNGDGSANIVSYVFAILAQQCHTFHCNRGLIVGCCKTINLSCDVSKNALNLMSYGILGDTQYWMIAQVDVHTGRTYIANPKHSYVRT